MCPHDHVITRHRIIIIDEDIREVSGQSILLRLLDTTPEGGNPDNRDDDIASQNFALKF
jgi:hypothetical protein